MSLVAYGSSGESDSEENENQEETTLNVSNAVNLNKDASSNNVIVHGVKVPNNDGNDAQKNDSFSQLKLTTSLLENSLKILDKNRSQPIRIPIPSLNEIKKNTEEYKGKKKIESKTPSGLLVLLAPPKNEISVSCKLQKNDNVTKKISSSNKSLVPRSVMKQGKPGSTQKEDDGNEEEWDSGKSFFFDPNENEPIQYKPIEPEFNEDPKPFNLSIISESNEDQFDYQEPTVDPGPSASHQYCNNNDGTLEVNAEALEKLCGRGERKRNALDIKDQIIDISADSLVGEASLWLTKDLTLDKPSSAKKAKNLSTVERRKHQITYLASQAKEKEMELRNQWANNRMTKKQTQAKYGF